MPIATRPTSTLPPPQEPTPSAGVTSSGAAPANLEVFEQAFAHAEASAQVIGSPRGGLLATIAGFGEAVVAALGGWLEPRCPNCEARGTVALELRAVAVGEPSRLWERCHACDTSWVSIRCEDLSGWS